METEKPTTQAAGRHGWSECCLSSALPVTINSHFALAVEAPVCIVTGGARGIGRAIAEMLGATGAKVMCASCSRLTPHYLHYNIAEDQLCST